MLIFTPFLKSLVANPAEIFPLKLISPSFLNVCLFVTLVPVPSSVNKRATCNDLFPLISPVEPFIPVTCGLFHVSGCTSIPATSITSKYIFPLFSNENDGLSRPPLPEGRPGSNVIALCLVISTCISVFSPE